MTVADQHTAAAPPALSPVVPRHDTPGQAGTAPASPTPGRRTALHVAFGILLAGTAALYLIGLGRSGYANSFYSAAAQAGSQSWKAWFFGSLDAGNSITVDKPPASLWVMGLSVRLFGLSSWSILVPQALMGVASVAILTRTVVRALGFDAATRTLRPSLTASLAGLLAGLTLAVTPAAALMFRFNNPDALLVLLEVVAAYCVVRATQDGSRTWLALAGVAIGFGFLTKMLQAFIVLPGFVIAYAVAAPVRWRRRIVDLLVAFGAMVVSAGWYVAIVELVPASARPFIGGSQTNSFLELVFGYNGFGRITGNETGSVGGGTGGTGGMWGSTGITRMFDSTSGGMIAWLIPAALLLSAAAVVLLGRRAWRNVRGAVGSDGHTQALSGIIVFAGWLVVTALVFSYMAGIYHDYYTVALAPGIAGALGIGAGVAWTHRDTLVARIAMAVTTAVTVVWAKVLLDRAGGGWATLGTVVLVIGLASAAALVVVHRLPAYLPAVVAVVALLAIQAGPMAYSVETASTPHTGSIVTAGPTISSGSGPGGNGGGRGGMGPSQRGQGTGGMPGGMPGQQGGTSQGGTSQGGTGTQQGAGGGAPGAAPGGTNQGGGAPGGDGMGGAGGGGLLNGASVSTELTQLLNATPSTTTWVAATLGSQNAASYQLATQRSVMAIGGFNGSDPSPTLAQFKTYVSEGKIHYFISSGTLGNQNGGSDVASQISSWVEQNFTATTVGGVTVYDLTSGS